MTRLFLARGARMDLPRLILLLQAGDAVDFFGYGLIIPFEIIYLHHGGQPLRASTPVTYSRARSCSTAGRPFESMPR
jgi:hypothetical protein